MKLVFCDSLSAAELCPNIAAGGGDCLFIALSPAVKVRLKELKLPFVDTLPYFDRRSHEQALLASKQAVDRLRSWCDFVEPGLGLKTAYRDTFIYWFRFVLHYCLFMMEVVGRSVEQHHASELVTFSYGRGRGSGYQVAPEDNYLAEVVKAFALRSGLGCKIVLVKQKGRIFRRVVFQGKRLAAFLRVMINRKYNLSQATSKPIVLTSPAYRMDKIAQELLKEFPSRPVKFLKPALPLDLDLPLWLLPWFARKHRAVISEQRRLLTKLANRVAGDPAAFAYQGVSYSLILSDKIEKSYLDFIMKLMLASIVLDQELQALAPAVVISNVCRIDDLVLAELCRSRMIPNLLISHGSHVKPKNKWEMIEWGEHSKQFLGAPFSHIAVQTPTTMGYFDAFPTGAVLSVTGPVTWGAKVARSRSARQFADLFGQKFKRERVKVLLHAGTPKATSSLRFYVYETADEYLKGIKDLAEVVNNSDDLLLVVKFRPSKEISVETISRLVPLSDRVVLSVDEPLLDVIGMADLVVSYSSTAIDESLQNFIPVLLYGGAGRYRHIDAAEVGRDKLAPAAVFHLDGRVGIDDGIRKVLSLKFDAGLFERYIYPETERLPIARLIRGKMGIS